MNDWEDFKESVHVLTRMMERYDRLRTAHIRRYGHNHTFEFWASLKRLNAVAKKIDDYRRLVIELAQAIVREEGEA